MQVATCRSNLRRSRFFRCGGETLFFSLPEVALVLKVLEQKRAIIDAFESQRLMFAFDFPRFVKSTTRLEIQYAVQTEEMVYEMERDTRMTPAVSSIKFNMKSQETMDFGSARAPAPVVYISVDVDSLSTSVVSSLPSKIPFSHHSTSKSSAIAASFPASV
ncbi:unnamed protein product [Peronospora farinosa]|uniref:Uncharacterized protein n=1 Tax=Peronospora farinosa TaxID=134698 RepID=A0AAV0T2D2_9STRA|nr:unnamed protein product [Peronospora farinosa]